MTCKEQRERAIAFHENNLKNQGGKGNAFELMCAREKSHKIKVAEQNEVDVFVKFITDEGKVQYLPAECKTNGGRIDELLNGTTKAKYIIYRLEFTQKLKNSVDVRIVPPIIAPVDIFVAMLRDVNAIKAINRNGQFDGYGIQVSSKKMYLRLLDYVDNYGEAVLFDNTKTFELWDLEGLEM